MRKLNVLLMLGLLFLTPLLFSAERPKTKLLHPSTVILQGMIEPYSVKKAISELITVKESGQKELYLYIDSLGGDFNAAVWMGRNMEAAQAAGMSITCYAGPRVASAAYYIYLHCSNRYALKTSMLFPHTIHVSIPEFVLPEELIVIGIRSLVAQKEWDGYARNITGMNEEDI